MKFPFLISFISTYLFFSQCLTGQEKKPKYSLDSYISNMQSVMTDSLKGNWIADNLIHNRINLFLYPNDHLILSVQMRNRIIYGESVKYTPGYANSINSDIGFLDLSTNLAQGKSFLLNTSLDRLFLKYTKGKFVGTIGRQRINWGQNYVWNPNDIFNVQNFFDFDYAEKPGSDAIRLQYYTAEASALEFAIKLNHDKQATAAAFYKVNTLGYDFQLLGGILDGEDYVFGGGFAGHIKNAGFNGEFSYFKPIENANDSASYFLFGLGSDYVFNNSLHIQGEALYQYSEKAVSATDFLSWYSGNLNVKKLSFTDFSIYGNISYPISPLINGSIACMLFPEIKGFFTGPTLNYSAGDNLELSIIAQGFSGILPDPLTNEKKRSTLFLGFLRCKLNF